MLRVANFAHLADDVRISSQHREERLELGRDIPTTDEIKRLIEAAEPGRRKAMLLIAVFGGLRASEIRGLRWRDVNLKEATLRVAQRADRFGTIGLPKSKAGTREIPLAPETVSELRKWQVACPPTDLDLVFPTVKRQNSEPQQSITAAWRRCSAGPRWSIRMVNRNMDRHAFRHFFASWCLNRKEAGGRELPPKEVQSLLGHSSIVMTMDVYGHLFPRKE